MHKSNVKALPVLWRSARRLRPWGALEGAEPSGRLGGADLGREDRASAEGGSIGTIPSF